MEKAPGPVIPEHPAAPLAILAPARWLYVAASRSLSVMLLVAIRMYRLILSPWIGNQCRFHPTCSRYAEEAVQMHGPFRGSWLAVRRLGKCHPWHEGGCDPVPPPHS